MSDNPLFKRFAGQCPAWPTNDRLTDIDGKAFLHYSAKRQPTRLRGHSTMTTLTVTARGQVTFRKDVLQHLGIRPGDKIELDLLPDGRGVLKAARPAGTISSFVGLLAGRTQKVATIEEINEAAALGWAGKK
jgi:bifunctional DNA-binding transcriptional regulator/antitoxin component of YhaV-PrlF toxin-antitoxin module